MVAGATSAPHAPAPALRPNPQPLPCDGLKKKLVPKKRGTSAGKN